ncbi:two-component system chemotaxis response regulator CheB [Sulfitobacter noctilucicola]|uniref:Protein-glutamate methylesterase/protein-glutamine glutaminase n=2 Tax=Sulfitobacter noctilucicola TaxID=1342301 RepID=A0A7W6M7F8_9RHOB|nr:two-component system chemotaxis response regulator CheB [Sulfitobacter noctilucicola]
MQHQMPDTAEPSLRASRTKKVVIVDDSKTIRSWLRVVFAQDARLEVVGEADSAEKARQVIKHTRPDVITLDIEMPGMSGLDFLDRLMQLRPMPVVMISGSTQSNSDATITALTLGAVDCILKPSTPTNRDVWKDISRRVFSAACSTVQVTRRSMKEVARSRGQVGNDELPLILIGASTGGVAALEEVLSNLHTDGPPVVVVQHMPGAFLVSFSHLLNRNLSQDVAIVRAGEPLGAGQIRLAPSQGMHTEIVRERGQWSCALVSEPQNTLHCPSVDVLFRSALPFSKDVIGVILTGLGRDGADALLGLRKAGARTMGQDEHTSVIYGMPRVAWEIGAVQKQLPLSLIGEGINRAAALHASGKSKGRSS